MKSAKNPTGAGLARHPAAVALGGALAGALAVWFSANVGAQVNNAQANSSPPAKPGEAYALPHFNVPHVDHPAPLTPSPAGVLGLDHTHILTGDIRRCMHFYVDLLGFTVAGDVIDRPSNPPMDQLLGFKNAHYKHALLNMPGGPTVGSHVPWIEIWEVTGENAPLDKAIYNHPTGNFQGKGYNAYRVTDLAALLDKLQAAGVPFVNTPLTRNGKPTGIYVVDPDGQLIELNQYRPDAQ
jgi:catechol 2,3-dioxygenase-like lactoylglutathione lyase family enzyme